MHDQTGVYLDFPGDEAVISDKIRFVPENVVSQHCEARA
jgi:hypothetical protein